MKLTFYDWMLNNGVSKSKAFEYANIYCFGGTVNNLQDKVYIQNLIDCYENYKKNRGINK